MQKFLIFYSFIIAVSAEKLIGAFTREYYFNIVSSKAGSKIAGDGASHQILVKRFEIINDLRKLFFDFLFMMNRVEVVGDPAGSLEISAAFNAHRKRMELIHMFSGQCGN
jgi:hypothetical protein